MRAGFTPLADFWSDFFEMTTRHAPPPRTLDGLSHYLHMVFGDLATHHVRNLDTLPFRIDCTSCRDDLMESARRDVRDTHLGILSGVVSAMTHVPIRADYELMESDRCTIRLDVARGPNGEPLDAYSKLLDENSLGSDGTTFWLQNSAAGTVIGLTEQAYTVLAELASERTPAEIAAATGYSQERVRQILDQCYAENMIYCRFAPKAEH